MQKSERFSIESESGVVLILLALLAVVIVSFAALIIDLSAYGNQREQAEEYARLAALAALEAHMGAAATATLPQKVQAALDRANTVSNVNVLITERNTGARLYSPALTPALGPNNGAQLIPGRWVPSLPTDGSDPCAGTYPCFVPENNLAVLPLPQITAYRVTGQIYDRFSTKLARWIFGNTAADFPVNVLATATVVPRRGVFIIDLSASQTRDTHVLRTSQPQIDHPLDGRGSEFVYTLSTENPGELAFQDTAWNNVLAAGRDRPKFTGNGPNSWRAFFNTAQAPDNTKDITTITQDQYRRMHFKDDYVKKYVLMDSDFSLLQSVYNANPNWSNYPFPHLDPASSPLYEISTDPALDYRHVIRVDKFRNPPDSDASVGFTYQGAEPLHSVFAGLNAAMTEFSSRRVAGDAASLMFVDSRLWYTRFVTMTDNFDYLLRLTDFDIPAGGINDDPPAYGAPANNNNILRTSTSGFELAIRHGLLPIGSGASKTNLSLAVNQALIELQRGNPTGFSSNFITIITDGLGNCRPCLASETCPAADGGFRCSNQYSYYNQAMANLVNTIRTQVQGRNISVNWIMLGDAIAPHMTSMSDGNGGCMTDEQARIQNVPMVMGSTGNMDNAFNNMSPSSPFYEASVVPYQIAVATKGLFGPIRPPATGCTTAAPRVPASCPGVANNPLTWVRETLDPYCRTQTQQIVAYMQKIIGDNPFTLVEVQ